MKVAVITRYFPSSKYPHRGRSAYETIRRMHDVDLHVLSAHPKYPSWLTPKSFPYEPVADCRPPADVPQAQYLEFPALPAISRPFNGFAMARVLRDHVAALRPDLILSYVTYPDCFAALRVGRMFGIPVIGKANGSDLNRIPDSLTERLTRWTLKNLDYVLTVSEALREKAISLGADPKRTRAILNGCDSTIFSPEDKVAARAELDIDHDCQLVLYVGRLDVAKGVRELLSAAVTLKSKFEKLRVVFIGEGVEFEHLTRTSASWSLEQNVTFIPLATSREIARWLAAADVFALPSYAEGCPNALLEALSSGRPVVASAVGGIPELLDENCGIMVPPRDSDALAAALEKALLKQWDVTAIARTRARSWEDVVRELYAVIKEVAPDRDFRGTSQAPTCFVEQMQ